ncbi:MAG: GAF domain-containing protein, partial [Anaerolineae bacterium]|nr:GAF domain-containing protein [Anaerolineae bacterium]
NQQLLRQTDLLYQIDRSLSQALTRDDALMIAVQEIAQYTSASQCRIVLYDAAQGQGHIAADAVPTTTGQSATFPMAGDFVYEFLDEQRQPLLLSPAEPDIPAEVMARYVTQFGAELSLLLPAASQQDLIGFLALDSLTQRPFSNNHVIFAQTVVDHLTTQIENLKLLDEALTSAQELIFLNQIQSNISSILNVEDLGQTIYREVGRLLDNSYFLLALYDDVTREYTPVLAVEKGQSLPLKPRILQRDEPLYKFLHGRHYLLTEKAADAALPEAMPGQSGAQSSLWIPLVREDTPSGLICVQSHRPRAYRENDVQLLRSIATQAGLALENARLFQETQLTLSETSVLYYLSSQLNSVDSLFEVLDAIHSGVVTDASDIHLWLFDNIPLENRQGITIATLTELTGGTIEGIKIGDTIRARSDEWLKWLDPADIQMLTISTMAEGFRRAIPQAGLTEQTTFVVIPLNVRGLWRGFIKLRYETQREFNEREMRILRALISQMSVAVDNRVLFDQIESALTRNERLYVASRLINTSQTIEDTLQAAIITSNEDSFVFWLGLVDSDATSSPWPQSLRLVARTEAGLVDKLQKTVDLSILNDDFLLNRSPLVLTDHINQADENPLLDWVHEIGAQFLALFPLFASNQFLGLFIITAQHYVSTNNEDIDSFLALSSQMSTQIENKRLLERTEAALNEARRLYAASRAIASAQDNAAIYESLAMHLSSPLLDDDLGKTLDISVSLLLAKPVPSEGAAQLVYAFQWTSNEHVELTPETGTLIEHRDVPLASFLQL